MIDAGLSRYLRREVMAYSPHYRSALSRAGATIEALPPTRLADVDDTAALVLRPDERSILRSGARPLAARLAWARLFGRQAQFGRAVIDTAYKPISWFVDGGLLVGATAPDLDRLAELGRRWLESAGVTPDDTVVSVSPPGPYLDFWETHLGARRAGLSTVLLGPDVAGPDVAALAPTVLAGRPGDLVRLFADADHAGEPLETVRTVLVTGEPLDEWTRRELEAALDDPRGAVLSAWAPTGVRSLWTQCRGGQGLHVSDDADHVELEGRHLLWTARGWHGTVLVRLDTGVRASIDRSRCGACGRDDPRVFVEPRVPAYARLLDSDRRVAAWQVELRTVGERDETLVFLAVDGRTAAGPVVRDLDAAIGATQFVVTGRRDVERRLAASGGERVLDLRQ